MTHRSLALAIAVCMTAALAGCEPKPKEPKATAVAEPVLLAQLGAATPPTR